MLADTFPVVVTLVHLLLLSASSTTAGPVIIRRQDASDIPGLTFGPSVRLPSTSSHIVSTTSIMYPGKMPEGQRGCLFTWIGIQGSASDGDLIQSIVGSYPQGGSECSDENADKTWCISSEVYGVGDSGGKQQFVGDQRTSLPSEDNGVLFNYTLVNEATGDWVQTMTDPVTGTLLATYEKQSSGPMTVWYTAVELQDSPTDRTPPIGLQEPQTYVKSTIVLADADTSYGDGISSEQGATYDTIHTPDGGKTWIIDKITIPPSSGGGGSSS